MSAELVIFAPRLLSSLQEGIIEMVTASSTNGVEKDAAKVLVKTPPRFSWKVLLYMVIFFGSMVGHELMMETN